MSTDVEKPSDLALQPTSPAVNAGVVIPAAWPDWLRDRDEAQPDLGALPRNVEPSTIGIAGRLPVFPSVRFTMEYAGLSGYIDDLYVRPAYRRLGVGRSLLEALSTESKRRGYRSLQVEVGRSNGAALSLYGQFGLHAATDDRILAGGRLPAAGD